MLEAMFWGLVAASTLIGAAILAIALPWRPRMIGLGAGFGAGALISAVTLDLTRSAFEAADVPVVVLGLGAGALTFSAGNWVLHRAGAVLTMLADTMMPEAFDEAGAAVGLATVLGYAIGALLTLV